MNQKIASNPTTVIMKIEKVREIALDMMKKQKLRGWKIEFNNAIHGIGTCHFYDKVIKFSRKHCELASDTDVLDTIAHEVAHAVVGYNKGNIHCDLWKAKCIELGGTGKVQWDDNNTIPHKYKSVCKYCNTIYKRHTFKRNLSCSVCDPKYNKKYELTFEEYNQFELPL